MNLYALDTNSPAMEFVLIFQLLFFHLIYSDYQVNFLNIKCIFTKFCLFFFTFTMEHTFKISFIRIVISIIPLSCRILIIILEIISIS